MLKTYTALLLFCENLFEVAFCHKLLFFIHFQFYMIIDEIAVRIYMYTYSHLPRPKFVFWFALHLRLRAACNLKTSLFLATLSPLCFY